jgi:hypothetical protein
MKKLSLVLVALLIGAVSFSQTIKVHVDSINWSGVKNGKTTINKIGKKANSDYIIDLQNKKMDVIFNYNRPSLKGIDIQVLEMNGVYTIEFDDVDRLSNSINQRVTFIIDIENNKVNWNSKYIVPGDPRSTENRIEFIKFNIETSIDKILS